MNIYFDFDGTIADTGPALVEAIRLSFLAENKPAPRASDIIPLMGKPLLEILPLLMEGKKSRAEILRFREQVEHYYAEMSMDEICLFPEMKNLLEDCAAYSKNLVILTNKPTRCVLNETAFLGIQPLFHAIVGADLVAAPKPETDILEMAHIMLEKAFTTERSFMVGDSTADIGMAKKAGMKAIGVTWGAQTADILKAAGADEIAQTVPELKKILQNYVL